MNNKYSIEIFYSDEDEGYIALAPDLSGCSAFGNNEEEALAEIKIAIDLWIKTALEEGRPLPKPSDQEIFKKFIASLTVSV